MDRLKNSLPGVFAFLIVLLLMPLGHALMVLNEQLLHINQFIGAAVIGLVGMALLAWGLKVNQKPATATVLGLLAGVLVWTGWVEFSFVWMAHKLQVQPLMENGEVATKPEYLVMLSSLGLLASVTLLYLFGSTRCTFFVWFQKRMGFFNKLKLAAAPASARPLAVITFMETLMLIWTFYIVLLLVYDKDIAGDRHPATYVVAFGSLAWSMYLMTRLVRIRVFDQAVRYAIPTVVIFWNFVEVIGRWDMFHEIWVHPFEYWLENTIILASLLGFIAATVLGGIGERKKERPGKRAAHEDSSRLSINLTAGQPKKEAVAQL
ncbi:MAG: hypothetical protein KJZ58_04430 [Flavobacteriales bacterium]|nr:hypothetical protein [Flavobacteriales bacterium]MCL4281492.1 hypothetical protein [Flavobacteriales bacterium]